MCYLALVVRPVSLLYVCLVCNPYTRMHNTSTIYNTPKRMYCANIAETSLGSLRLSQKRTFHRHQPTNTTATNHTFIHSIKQLYIRSRREIINRDIHTPGAACVRVDLPFTKCRTAAAYCCAIAIKTMRFFFVVVVRCCKVWNVTGETSQPMFMPLDTNIFRYFAVNGN